MSEHTYTVYIHKSPSNKYYVGITHLKPEYRWNSGDGYKQNKHFYSAIQKYGWNNFEHIIVATDVSCEVACEMEQNLILGLRSNLREFGYNKSIGGEKTALGCHYKTQFSREHRQALKRAWERRREKGLGIPWNKGKKLKDTGKIDNFLKVGALNGAKKRKAVCQIDPNTGMIVAEYESMLSAARSCGRNHTAGICPAVHRGTKAYGYYWKLKET